MVSGQDVDAQREESLGCDVTRHCGIENLNKQEQNVSERSDSNNELLIYCFCYSSDGCLITYTANCTRHAWHMESVYIGIYPH